MQHPKKISEKELLNNGYRRILEKNFEVKDGSIHHYLTVSHAGAPTATLVLPFTENNEVIYITEYRVWPEIELIDFPIGVLDTGKTPIENAQKELEEESGYASNDIQYLGKSIGSVYDDTIVQYYIAKNCRPVKQNLEVGEYIEVHTCSIEAFEAMIKQEQVLAPLALSAWTFAKAHGYIF